MHLNSKQFRFLYIDSECVTGYNANAGIRNSERGNSDRGNTESGNVHSRDAEIGNVQPECKTWKYIHVSSKYLGTTCLQKQSECVMALSGNQTVEMQEEEMQKVHIQEVEIQNVVIQKVEMYKVLRM
jgi:hypothetical protein